MQKNSNGRTLRVNPLQCIIIKPNKLLSIQVNQFAVRPNPQVD